MSCNKNDMSNQRPITIDWLAEIFFQLTHEIVEKKGEGVTWDEFPKEEFIKAITDRMKNEGADEQSKQLAKAIIQYCELQPRENVSKGSLNLKKIFKSEIDTAIEKYKENMWAEGYNYSEWSVDPEIINHSIEFVESLPTRLPRPYFLIADDDLWLCWGDLLESWLTLELTAEGYVYWSCAIYSDPEEDPKDFEGAFLFKGFVPDELINKIEEVELKNREMI